MRGGGSLYTNPLLECNIAKGSLDAQKLNFSTQLNDRIRSLESEHQLNSVGIYFRDLNNGPTFGLNQDENYLPASLLKLPVAMAFYKLAEGDEALLEKSIPFTQIFLPPGVGDTQYIPPSTEIVAGEAYTIRELIRRSLVYSDNQAISLLYQELNATHPEVLRSLYALLGVSDAVLDGPDATLTVKQYSAFLRVLYNASFLNVANSETVLSLLVQSEFSKGLVAGVPSGIPVAHKFGESGYQNGERQIHDCGIVYYPKHPYILCTMTRGNSADALERSIADISKFVFEQVDAQYIKN